MRRRSSVRCKKCRTSNSASSIYCVRCGSSLREQGYTPRGTMRVSRYTGKFIFRLVIIAALVGALAVFAIVVNDFFKPKPSDAMAFGPVNGSVASTSTTAPGKPLDTATTAAPTDTATTAPVDTTPSDTTDTSQNQETTDTAAPADSTTTTIGMISVRPDSARASSSLPAKPTENFGATNVLDGELSTSWVDGGQLKVGRQSLRFTFLKPIAPARIDFANGYQKDESTYAANGRVRGLRIEYSNGRSQTVNLLDTQQMQYVIPLQAAVTWIKISVLSIYPGSQETTVALSEVRFYEFVTAQ